MGGQQGFTLTELLAVMAILAVLAGLVASAVAGTGSAANSSRLAADANAVGKGADAFFNDADPQLYPVVSLSDTDEELKADTDLGIQLIDFDANLPGDGSKAFVPDFVKDVPSSAGQVSWRIDTNTGTVFFARNDAKLIQPSSARFKVTATSTTPLVASEYIFELRVKKNEAGVKILEVDIPAGYSIGGQTLDAGAKMGTLDITFKRDNPWRAGEEIIVDTADVVASGERDEWFVVVDYDSNSLSDLDVKDSGVTVRTHTISILTPTVDSPGRLTLEMDRTDDPDENEATETFTLVLFGHPLVDDGAGEFVEDTDINLITNPETEAVYRWLAEEHTTIDPEDLFDVVPGNQAVIIK